MSRLSVLQGSCPQRSLSALSHYDGLRRNSDGVRYDEDLSHGLQEFGGHDLDDSAAPTDCTWHGSNLLGLCDIGCRHRQGRTLDIGAGYGEVGGHTPGGILGSKGHKFSKFLGNSDPSICSKRRNGSNRSGHQADQVPLTSRSKKGQVANVGHECPAGVHILGGPGRPPPGSDPSGLSGLGKKGLGGIKDEGEVDEKLQSLQHPSLAGFPIHHLNGYKLLVSFKDASSPMNLG